jgi:hypothetical protein
MLKKNTRTLVELDNIGKNYYCGGWVSSTMVALSNFDDGFQVANLEGCWLAAMVRYIINLEMHLEEN